MRRPVSFVWMAAAARRNSSRLRMRRSEEPRLNSSHANIYRLPLPDALPICRQSEPLTLMKSPLAGGNAGVIPSIDGEQRVTSWKNDGSLIFATTNASTGLFRVDGGGGTPQQLTAPDAEIGRATPELQSRQYLPSSPTRRSSDLPAE